MRVIHLCLSNFFIEDRAYQENELVDEHVKQGHEVLVVASSDTRDINGKKLVAKIGEIRIGSGARLIRLNYKKYVPYSIASRVRAFTGLYNILEDYQPDVIMFHGICGWDLMTASRYKKKNPNVKFYADTHTDFINSAKGFLSKWLLHGIFYRTIVNLCLDDIEKVFYISELTRQFAHNFYGLPESKLEFLPLGGHPISDHQYVIVRSQVRKELGISDKDIVFIQSGKQSKEKGLLESLRAFVCVPDSRFRFFIVGSILDEIRDQAEQLIQSDSRISFLGWKKPEDLKRFLCAADVYMQPGSQSSTMQTSLCCRCAQILSNIEGHGFYANGTGWLVSTENDIRRALSEISAGTANVDDMKGVSKKLAIERLDYEVLAKRVIQ